MARLISLGDEILDSRDIIERIAHLERDEESLDEDEKEELAGWRELRNEADGSPDWKYGEALILDSYFEEYARQLAEDTGAIGKDAPWPACHIDWSAAADALKMDYTEVEAGGFTYWIRS